MSLAAAKKLLSLISLRLLKMHNKWQSYDKSCCCTKAPALGTIGLLNIKNKYPFPLCLVTTKTDISILIRTSHWHGSY